MPGNHDHQLAEPLLERQRLDGGRGSLQLERSVEPGEPGPAGAVAGYLDGAEVAVAYPGLWLRPDVYATHGHYLDCHMTVPRPECLLAALMQAAIGRLPEQRGGARRLRGGAGAALCVRLQPRPGRFAEMGAAARPRRGGG